MAKLSIKPDSTSVSLLLFIQDSASTTGGGKTGLAYNTASLTCYGVRPGEAAAAISLVTQTVTGAWSSGGFVEIDSANMPGMYRFDVPNARLAAGVRSSAIMFKGASGMAPLTLEIDLNAEVNLSGVATASALATLAGYVDTEVAAILAAVDTEVAAIKAKTDNLPTDPADESLLEAAITSAVSPLATAASIAALNNISSAQVQTAATAALNAYDPPTNTEMEARTLAAANYATATVLDAVGNFVDTEVAAIKAVTDKLDTALVLDGAVYQLTANALELAPAGGGGGATAQQIWEYADGTGRTINSVSSTVTAQLADGVVHGGTTAELTLKKAVLSNTSNQGIALSLRGGNPASPGHAIALLDENGTLGTGRIRGYIDGVVNGVALATEAITDAAFDATGLQAVADALKLAPTAGDPATGSVYDLLANVGTGSGTVEPAQLDWSAWATPDGALADLYDDNAVDELTHSGTTLTAEGDTGFAAWVMQEFDDKLFVGVGKTPANHIAAVIGSLATAGATPTFEYALPEEGVAAMRVGPDGKFYVAGADERANTGDSSIYVRTAEGTWTRKQTISNTQHIWGLCFVGSRLWVAGQGNPDGVLYSNDYGDTWQLGGLGPSQRYYDVIGLGSAVIVTAWDPLPWWPIYRTLDSGVNWNQVTGIESGTGRMVEWEGVIVGVSNTGKLFTVNSGGTGTEYTPPFTPRQTYNNLAVDTDGYLCVLGQTGVWRTNDLANWKQVWSFSPADTVRSLGTWGDDLVVSTDGATAQVLARPASPEAAQQQMYRDALKLAASPGTAEAGSTDANIDAIRLITDAIDTSAVTVTSSNNAGVLTFTRGVTFAATVSGLTISATWAKLYFTLKESDYDTDDMALLQLVESNPGVGTDGLLYLNSAALVLPIAATDGTLTVSQAAGTVAIAITDNAMAALSKASGLVWDIKTKDTAGATVQNATGTASIGRAITQTI